MAPKKTGDSGSEEARNLVTLCHLMTCSEGGFGSTAILAPILGISHGKNVPRKINQIISPHGFEFKGGRVVKTGEDGAPATPATPAQDGEDVQGTPASKKKKPAVKKYTTAAKKRKVEEVEEGENAKTEEGEDTLDSAEEA